MMDFIAPNLTTSFSMEIKMNTFKNYTAMFYDGLVPNPNPSNNTKITFIKKSKIFKPIITGYNIL